MELWKENWTEEEFVGKFFLGKHDKGEQRKVELAHISPCLYGDSGACQSGQRSTWFMKSRHSIIRELQAGSVLKADFQV